MLLFYEDEIRQQVTLGAEVIDRVEHGFTQLNQGKAVLPPIMRIDIPEHNGEVDIKSAYIKGLDSFAVKLSSGFFNNSSLGLPSLSGMMLLISSVTGLPEAILLDNGYLTDVRTAAAGAIAAKHLAIPQVDTVGVIGTGTQARVQMEALHQVRPFRKLLVYGRTEESVQAYIADMQQKLPVDVVSAASPEQVVRASEIVVTTTPSKAPLIQADWLHPGLHITAMGSDTEHKQEIDTGVFRAADLIVCDVKAQCLRLGELHHAVDDGVLDVNDCRIHELGELTSGAEPGRTDDDQITICDLTGTGVQDTAIARFACERLSQEKQA